MRRPTLLLCALLLAVAGPTVAGARSPEECQNGWGKAARSYMHGKDTAAVDDAMFKEACALDASGERDVARAEAVRAAAAALNKVEPAVCQRFVQYFIGAAEPEAVCQAAMGEDPAAARKAVADLLPPPPKRRKKG